MKKIYFLDNFIGEDGWSEEELSKKIKLLSTLGSDPGVFSNYVAYLFAQLVKEGQLEIEINKTFNDSRKESETIELKTDYYSEGPDISFWSKPLKPEDEDEDVWTTFFIKLKE